MYIYDRVCNYFWYDAYIYIMNFWTSAQSPQELRKWEVGASTASHKITAFLRLRRDKRVFRIQTVSPIGVWEISGDRGGSWRLDIGSFQD